ncbi:hypothetical protein RSP799_18290 [Ralstonia solanacearum]|nr:hypothetical protein RSP799_18290 [Ralstonia solanacearum]
MLMPVETSTLPLIKILGKADVAEDLIDVLLAQRFQSFGNNLAVVEIQIIATEFHGPSTTMQPSIFQGRQ